MNQSTKINLIGCDTIVNSPSDSSKLFCFVNKGERNFFLNFCLLHNEQQPQNNENQNISSITWSTTLTQSPDCLDVREAGTSSASKSPQYWGPVGLTQTGMVTSLRV